MNNLKQRMTVQNVEGTEWAITWEQEFSERESMSFTVLVPKGNLTVVQLQRAALQEAVGKIQRVLENMAG